MRWPLALVMLGLALPIFGAAARADDLQPVPELRGPVNDSTGTLTAGERATLEQKLTALKERKGAQLVVLIVPTTAPETDAQYAIRVGEAWKIWRTGVGDGALLLVAKDDRAVRIEVGYGLEGAIPDALANRIIDQEIVPRFRAGDFGGGVEAGVDAMVRLVDGEPLPPPDPRWEPSGAKGIENILPVALFAIPILGGILRKIFGGVLGPLIAGGVMFALVWLVTGVFLIALGFALFAALFAALAGRRLVGRAGRGRHGWGGGWGGGGFGGGGFGGGGGWGGGGGHGFGGGGASGRW